MAAAIVAFLPLIQMLPSLVKEIQDFVSIMRTPELTEAERKARLDALAARLDARVAEIEAMQLPAPRTD